ncbi:MAG: VWA domain-containing protein [Candidatus Poribacteria bacterium]|nr:VWA domain-containing protein [Candidatus Poribacteria bacterium]
MRNVLTVLFSILVCGYALAADKDTLEPRSGLLVLTPGELKIEIHSPTVDLSSTSPELSFEVEGVASTIGGVRFIDMMLVLDTSTSLRSNDPDDYRTAAAIGLIENLSPKSDTNIGVVGFSSKSELTQPLTSSRDDVVLSLQALKRSGGTDLAAGILTALEELTLHGRPESSRVIVLFTDGMSNEKKARAATRQAQSQGIAIQTMLLGENLKGGFLLEEIAQATGGSFVWVTDPAKLPEAFLNLRTTGVDHVTLSVNGSQPVPARLAGGTFTGTVSLQLGENRIVALATSLDEQTKESVITVQVSDTSCATLVVAALDEGQPTLSLNERAVEIVVDASRSMWGQIDGKAKMTVAKEILRDASFWLPDDLNLALRAYGSTTRSKDNNCTDSAMLVPFGTESRAPIREAIAGLKPLGQTPIAYALNQAAADFAELESERTFVLVTDCIESCGGDPVAAARELREQGIMIHLIGFGLNNSADEDASSLQAIADASGGIFLTANSAEELRSALEVTVGTRFRVLQENMVVARGVLGSDEPIFLPMGDYRVQLDSVPVHEVQVSLAARDELTLTLEKRGGVVSHFERRGQLRPTSCEDAIASKNSSQESQRPAVTAATTEPRKDPAWADAA